MSLNVFQLASLSQRRLALVSFLRIARSQGHDSFPVVSANFYRTLLSGSGNGVGEAAGALAAWCMARGLQPRQVRGDAALLNDFQSLLRDKLGFILEWPEYARLTPR